MALSLTELQSLYDQNRFVEAYRQSTDCWRAGQSLKSFSVDELILGGRIAARLGGWRLSRHLFRTAVEREPANPRAQYFGRGARRSGWKLFEQLRSWEAQPSLPGADSNTQANWLAWQAVTWAMLRDFARAHRCIEQARSLDAGESWVYSCEANVLGIEDRWADALEAAEIAWEKNPGTPYAAHSLGDSLVNLGRIRQAAERLSRAAEGSESFEVAHSACWHVCAVAEAEEGEERRRLLAQAEGLAQQMVSLAVLADREARAWFARTELDISELKDDHEGMKRWADEVRSPFHRKMLENLRKNPQGARIRMSFRRAIQKHDECLPTSVASALAAMGTAIDAEEMAREITFGGTPEWAAAEWLEKRGLAVRFFVAKPEVARRLIQNRFAFVMTLEADASAHAVAAVGLDEAAGTLLVHDPSVLRSCEYLLEYLGEGEAPLGPRAMAIVPQLHIERLEELLPKEDQEAVAGRAAYQRATQWEGPGAARKVAEKLAEQQPQHPMTKLLQALQAVEDGRVGMALVAFQELVKEFPRSPFVRAQLLMCSRSLGDTALMRRTLAQVVERGTLPGVQSQQSWLYPPSTYVSEYADLLRNSAETRQKAKALLNGVIGREGSCAQAWHVLADLLWDEGERTGAVLAYRIASGLATSSEHYARAYCDALGITGKQEEGFAWLERRVRVFGGSALAVATWITWVGALEDWGYPQRALEICNRALKSHAASPELLGFAVSFLARMGEWTEAEQLLERLKSAGNARVYHEAGADFSRRQGELEKALMHLEAWVHEAPLDMNARRELLRLIAKRDGNEIAAERAKQWYREHPGRDYLEQLYGEYLELALEPRWKTYAVMRRRAKRNPQDGWAWRQLAFNALGDYETKNESRREKLERRITRLIAQCERTAPGEAATMRLRAHWSELRGEWAEATEHWMDSIRCEPHNVYSYRAAWDNLARATPEQRRELWQRLSEALLTYAGRLESARETILMVARRFGVAEAETAVAGWKKNRPDDPYVTEAYADLLLEYGHGRTDAQRAFDLLQPEVDRYPYHEGLRFSLADAHKRLGNFQKADEIYSEILRRHPDNSTAQMQRARVDERHGRAEVALQNLAAAARRDPQNVDLYEVRTRILIGAGRAREAREVLDEGMRRFPKSVTWRERAILLYQECGDTGMAVKVAREGVQVYPRGSYLWFLLGRTLNHNRAFAGQGEVETCLRKSLQLNEGLFVVADTLAMVLVDQRRYDEAEAVMKRIERRLGDPTAAMGRVAWIHRAKGDRGGAREEMARLVRETPWYEWGWRILLEWLGEDEAWSDTRTILKDVPAELRTNTQFQRQRLMLLEKTGLAHTELDSEWNRLLSDFPEEVPLYLYRYDSLLHAKRAAEAAKVLEAVRGVDPESPYVLARYTEVLASDAERKEQSVEALLKILFADREDSTWPANYGWEAVKSAGLEAKAYEKSVEELRRGAKPTLTAISLLAAFPVEHWGTQKLRLQVYWNSWFPDRGVREVRQLQKAVDRASWPKEQYRARLLKQLNDVGHARLVVRYWKKNRAEVEGSAETWAETGRALMVLKRRKAARKLLGNWRERSGVGMWTIGNYVNSLTGIGKGELREVRDTCRDALAGIPHDHCAKYLAHRQLEACALLGDEKALLEGWKASRSYFEGKLEEGEWFSERKKYLLGELLVLGRALEGNDRKMYRTLRRGLWWRAMKGRLSSSENKANRGAGAVKWWWLVWPLLMLLRAILQQH